jgi:uncharacterized membrane-anchored protein
MFKDINGLGVIASILSGIALLFSATLFLFIFAMFFALLALIAAHFAKKSWWVRAVQVVSGLILLFWIVVLIIALLSTPR